MKTQVLKTQGNLITAILRGSDVIRVGELSPTDKTASIVSFFRSNDKIWAVLSTGEHINTEHL